MLPFPCVDNGDHGFGIANHGEDRFQDHPQDHRDGQEEYGPSQAARGIIVGRSADGLL